jgi:hypothetical protein
MAVLNTRIKLRNDLISNWIGSTTLIQKGEVALGYDDSKYVIKIGTTDTGTVWDDLPENLTIPATNIVGLKDYRLVEDSASAGTFKLQYTTDGSVWTDVENGTISLAFTGTYNKTTNPIALKDYVDTQVAGATTQYFEGIRSITYDENGAEIITSTDVDADIYFNKAGFDKNNRKAYVDLEIVGEDSIDITPTGVSGQLYNNHEKG